MKIEKFSAGKYRLTVFIPDKAPDGAIYIPMHGGAEEIISLLPEPRAALVFIHDFDWNQDLSPWPAKAVFGAEDFAGGADAFLGEWIRLIPEIEQRAAMKPLWRGIAGYSLAGLFAVYAVYRCDLFTRVASVSGSVWFDDWMNYAENTPFAARVERAYFSVGAREKKTRNARMQPVEDNTRAMNELFVRRGAESRFVLNPGNHFVDAGKRLTDALEWLSK